jgi:hypothetical protein
MNGVGTREVVLIVDLGVLEVVLQIVVGVLRAALCRNSVLRLLLFLCCSFCCFVFFFCAAVLFFLAAALVFYVLLQSSVFCFVGGLWCLACELLSLSIAVLISLPWYFSCLGLRCFNKFGHSKKKKHLHF